MNEETIINILDTLASEYSKNFSAKEKSLRVRTWVMMLKNITDEQGYKGLEKALDNPSEFMPTVGKFKEFCLSGAGSKSLEDDAHEAWALVRKNLNSWISPIFKDSCIAEAIRKMGGWKQLCGMLTIDATWRGKEFVDYYLVALRENKEFLPMLRGEHEDYKFIGYDKTDNLEKLLKAIKSREQDNTKILRQIEPETGNRRIMQF